MGYIRRPDYYKNFKCISSECTDSCCQEWEIDIDDETLEYYMQVEGEFGDRLRKHIKIEEMEEAHFIQTKEERCPFLNECGLCDIFIHLGEEHLSQICTHHPRYYDWFLEGEEAGLGLCCEEAARLILQKSGYPVFEVMMDEENDRERDAQADDEDVIFQRKIEQMLFDMREKLFKIIKPDVNGKEDNPDEKMKELYKAAGRFQCEYEDVMFPMCQEDLEDDETDFVGGGKEENEFRNQASYHNWNEQFWQKEFLEKLITFYLELEINDENWWKLLGEIRRNLSEILNKRGEFLKYYQENLYEYEQLMIYFIFRHFMKARNDDAVFEKIVFALISTDFIQMLDIYEWMMSGEITLKSQVNICKLYSKEIEYDEENMEQVSRFLS